MGMQLLIGGPSLYTQVSICLQIPPIDETLARLFHRHLLRQYIKPQLPRAFSISLDISLSGIASQPSNLSTVPRQLLSYKTPFAKLRFLFGLSFSTHVQAGRCASFPNQSLRFP
ncbi:hypothetical protein RvY_10101-2 [Ramazzottius varieornatus]|uniref:Uncharacterized protein n=1 Tax=Ramazzottius varieornatus TaxID=947166 RepID=A0A1D1VKN3_RAMVA|nr:hypothetical protein RvY_10101-2 [Ramazzottius varieornatus]